MPIVDDMITRNAQPDLVPNDVSGRIPAPHSMGHARRRGTADTAGAPDPAARRDGAAPPVPALNRMGPVAQFRERRSDLGQEYSKLSLKVLGQLR